MTGVRGCFFAFLKDLRNNGRTYLGELEPAIESSYLFMNLFEMFIDLEKKFIDLTFATSDREMFLDAMSLDIIEELNSPLWGARVDIFTQSS